jgi:hypothetical protein
MMIGLKVASTDEYVDKLTKMIPAEVVAIYVPGLALVPPESKNGLLGWLITCFILVIIFRYYATAKSGTNGEPNWPLLGISLVSFLVWAYFLGGAFKAFQLQIEWVGQLGIMVWTAVAPLFYDGAQALKTRWTQPSTGP